MSNDSRGITPSFTAALFLYFCIGVLTSSLFSPTEKEAPWDAVYESFPTFSVIMALLLGISLLGCGAKLGQVFWNRLISNLLGVREIDFQEALSIVLVLSVISNAV